MTEPRWDAEAWRRLADEVRAARDIRGLTQAELARDARIGLRTLQDIEAGVPRGRFPRLLPRIERALGWRPGSGRIILDGGEPVPTNVIQPRPKILTRAQKDGARAYLEIATKVPRSVRQEILAELEEIPETTDPTST